jgi:hypothetical protein
MLKIDKLIEPEHDLDKRIVFIILGTNKIIEREDQ